MTAKSGLKRIVADVFTLPGATSPFVWNGRFAPIAGEKENYIGGYDMNGDLTTINNDLPAIADDTLIQVADQAEKRIDAVNRIKGLALKVTNAHDWTDQGGRPYLQASGGEKVARLFGISWTISEPVYESEEGGHFSYTYTGTFSLSGATIVAVGTRSSKDGFFKKYDYAEKDNNGKSIKKELPASEIDKGDVKKSAYTNLIGNGITRLLGIRNLTWDDLSAAGIRKENVGKIDYKKDNKKTDKAIYTDESNSVVTEVLNVTYKEGTKKDGSAYTKYTIKTNSGDFNTFSETFALFAKDRKEDGELVKIVYKEGRFGNDLEGITLYEAQQGPEAQGE
jgi:hypothetical protein